MPQKSTCTSFIETDLHTYLKLITYFAVQTDKGQQFQQIRTELHN